MRYLSILPIALLLLALLTGTGRSSTPTISNPTNTLVDVGQTETFNAFVSGGSPPYTYYFFVANTAALSPYTEYPTSANYVTFQVGSADLTNGNEIANVIVVDNLAHTVNSVYSSSFAISPALSLISLTASNTPTITPTEYEVLSAPTTGGSGTITYTFTIYNSVTNAPLATTSGSSSTWAWAVPSADVGNTILANVIATDSASTQESVGAVLGSAITIIPLVPQSTPTITPTYSQGGYVTQGIAFNAYVYGGIPIYTYNFIVYNTINNAIIATVLTTTNNINYTIPFGATGTNLAANVIVTSPQPATTNSIPSGTVYVSFGIPPGVGIDFSDASFSFLIIAIDFLILEKRPWLWEKRVPGVGVLLFFVMLITSALYTLIH